MQGGVILFRGAGADALRYVESDRSRADDYYLGSDATLAEFAALDSGGNVTAELSLGSVAYAGWVDWTHPVTGEQMGRPRRAGPDRKGSPRFAEMVINTPKSLSIAAALHPEVSEALDAAQQDALAEIRRWLAQHSVTRVGPLGAQEVVPAEQVQVVGITHRTTRAGDPHLTHRLLKQDVLALQPQEDARVGLGVLDEEPTPITPIVIPAQFSIRPRRRVPPLVVPERGVDGLADGEARLRLKGGQQCVGGGGELDVSHSLLVPIDDHAGVTGRHRGRRLAAQGLGAPAVGVEGQAQAPGGGRAANAGGGEGAWVKRSWGWGVKDLEHGEVDGGEGLVFLGRVVGLKPHEHGLTEALQGPRGRGVVLHIAVELGVGVFTPESGEAGEVGPKRGAVA